MLLGTLDASMYVNMIIKKGIVIAGKKYDEMHRMDKNV